MNHETEEKIRSELEQIKNVLNLCCSHASCTMLAVTRYGGIELWQFGKLSANSNVNVTHASYTIPASRVRDFIKITTFFNTSLL